MRRSPRGASRAGRIAICVSCLWLALPAPAPARAQPAGGPPTSLVRIPFPQEDGDLTPYGFQLGYPLVTLVYDTLMWRDESGVPGPWLAEAVDQSPDGRRLTLHLAKGVRFHDGHPLSADDVVFSFRYFADHPHPRFTPELVSVSGIRATDPSTVVVELRQASPGFVDQPLADLPILPAHLWRALPSGRRSPEGPPVGSGPYRLTRHDTGKSYRFEANAEYFRGRPSVAAIEVPILGDANATLQALESRRVDMIPLSLPPAAAARVKSLGIKEVTGVSYVGTTLTFNLRRPPFDQLEARQAVAKAIDLRRLADGVGSAVPADHGYLHPESRWSSPDVLQVTDPSAARQAGARVALPPVGVLAADNDPVAMEAARQVVLALQRAGMQAAVDNVSRDAVSTALGEDGSEPDFDMAVTNISPLASYDPDFLRRLFGPTSGVLNPSGYRSPVFDQLANGVATTIDPAARRVAVTAELRQLASDVPSLPLLFPVAHYSYRPAIYDGWVFVKGTGILDKRSFLGRPGGSPATVGNTVAAPTPAGERDEEGGGGGPSPLQLVSRLLAALAVVIGGAGAVRWWRARRVGAV